MNNIETMKLALEAFKRIDDEMPFPVAKLAMQQLRQAIEQAQKQPAPMSQPNRLIAYSAAEKLRSLGYQWDEKTALWQAQKQEPVAWATREDFYFELNRRVDQMRKEMVIKTVTMRCKEYDLALPIVDMYGGHIVVGQVITPPPRQPLTDEEMKAIWYAMQNIMGWYSFQEIARAIEAAHGIKENT